jgi:hypothetical protein
MHDARAHARLGLDRCGAPIVVDRMIEYSVAKGTSVMVEAALRSPFFGFCEYGYIGLGVGSDFQLLVRASVF